MVHYEKDNINQAAPFLFRIQIFLLYLSFVMTLYNQVSNEYKRTLESTKVLLNESDTEGCNLSIIIGAKNFENLDHNEGQQLYFNSWW